MSLTSRELKDVAAELSALKGAIVQRAFVPEPRTAIFELRKPGASHLLLLCAESGRTRVHLAEARPPSPEPPYALQGFLRAELTGLALRSIEVVPGERCVTLHFANDERDYRIVGELTGRHGNLFVLDREGKIRMSAVPNLSEARDNRGGQPYVPLLPRTAIPKGDDLSRFTSGEGDFSLSRQIDLAYAGREQQERVDERRKALLSGLKTKRDRLTRTLEKVKGDLSRMSKADEHQQRGELLKSNLHLVKRGMKEVRLTSYTETGAEEVTVTLDPARTPKENLERAFHQYRRLVAGQARAGARLAELERELAVTDAALEKEKALTDDELLAMAGSAPRPLVPRPKQQKRSGPWREYLSASGQRIRVGRGASENDELTRKSKGNDVWLHVRGLPGAHVVVPLDRDAELKEETLRDAALLAAHHSDAKGQDRVEVAHTRVKYVRKPKGAAPGAVTYTQDKTWLVRADPERLARLLSSSEEP